jgi:hypothetical protein
MKSPAFLPKFISTFFVFSLSILLTACGGGGGDKKTDSSAASVVASSISLVSSLTSSID